MSETEKRICPDCGRQLDESENACPHCGEPPEDPSEQGSSLTATYMVSFLVFCVVLVLGLKFFFFSPSPPQAAPVEKPAPAITSPKPELGELGEAVETLQAIVGEKPHKNAPDPQ